ncbi:type II restriction endonuclease, partial [Ursidibacter arcticus]
MKTEEIEVLFKLSDAEEAKFADFIKENRAKWISSPKENARKATENNKALVGGLLSSGKISEA